MRPAAIWGHGNDAAGPSPTSRSSLSVQLFVALNSPHTHRGLGEILGYFPKRKKKPRMGPLPISIYFQPFGGTWAIASRVGEVTSDGKCAATSFPVLGNNDIQFGSDAPHGSRKVPSIRRGPTRFLEVTSPAAWEFWTPTPDWSSLQKRPIAVCFGTLAQRLSAILARTIQGFSAYQTWFSPCSDRKTCDSLFIGESH